MPELPEGTDHIVPGAAATSRHDDAPADIGAKSSSKGASGSKPDADDGQTKGGSADVTGSGTAGDLRDRAQGKVEEFRAQAADHARDFAEQGKARASGALDDLARMLTDNAAQIDEKLGSQYGDYARRAADYVSGTAGQIRDKEVEDLLEDARDLVRRAPSLAVGGAAAVGFLLARVLKAGGEALEAGAAELDRSRQTGA